MSEEVLGRRTVAGFRYRVQDEHQKELQTICDQYLFLVFEHHMIVWHSPCGRIVFQSLWHV